MEVPSGSIYKHLLEEQSQLADSLEKSRTRKATRDAIQVQARKERTTIKQKPNTLNEYDSDEAEYRDNDVDDVRGLDDLKTESSSLSTENTITKRLAEKRLLKHSKALADLDSELSSVKNTTEGRLSATLQKVNTVVFYKKKSPKIFLREFHEIEILSKKNLFVVFFSSDFKFFKKSNFRQKN